MQRIKPINFEPPIGKIKPKKSSSLIIKVIIALCILCLLIVMFFLFTTKSVKIKTFPDNANITINSFLHVNYSNSHLLLKNNYKVNISAKGYHDLSTTLEVSDEKYQEQEYILKPLPGNLAVNTNAKAKVYINDVEKGETPITIKVLEQGSYSLGVEAERYIDYKQELEIKGLGETQELNIELKPAWADIRFASEPEGADIIIDDETLGETPTTIEVLEGERKISISKEGFKPWKKTIKVKPQEAMSFEDIQLFPADATLRLSSNPINANVTLNDNYLGQTPLTVALTPGESARLRLYKQGYLAKTTRVSAKSGENKKLTINMLPELVDVKFNIQPKDTEILINGKTTTLNNGIIALPTTPQKITFRKQGYVEQNKNITPRHGVAQEISITLKTLQQQKQENIKPIYTNSIGQTLKLFYPYTFTMGASRREPGRRANEAIRTASLSKPFYLSSYETTNEQFRRFQSSHNSGSVQGKSLNADKQPVANITWEQAVMFCNWLSQQEALTPFYNISNNKVTGINRSASGYRLPSEAEWAWAARAKSKNDTLKFSWGNNLPPPNKSGNFADYNAAGFLGKIVKDYDDGHAVSAPVGQFTANHKGLYDIEGNVAEWVHDYYSVYTNNSKSPTDSFGPTQGEFHVIRGASWSHGSITELRLSYRDYAKKAREDVGFRVARYLD